MPQPQVNLWKTPGLNLRLIPQLTPKLASLLNSLLNSKLPSKLILPAFSKAKPPGLTLQLTSWADHPHYH